MGRWLNRDHKPVDPVDLYNFISNKTIQFFDVLGMYAYLQTDDYDNECSGMAFETLSHLPPMSEDGACILNYAISRIEVVEDLDLGKSGWMVTVEMAPMGGGLWYVGLVRCWSETGGKITFYCEFDVETFYDCTDDCGNSVSDSYTLPFRKPLGIESLPVDSNCNRDRWEGLGKEEAKQFFDFLVEKFI